MKTSQVLIIAVAIVIAATINPINQVQSAGGDSSISSVNGNDVDRAWVVINGTVYRCNSHPNDKSCRVIPFK